MRMKLVFEDCNHISMEPFCPNKEEFGAVMKSSFHILDSIDLTAEGTSREICFATVQFVQIRSAFSKFGSLFWVNSILNAQVRNCIFFFFFARSTYELHSELCWW